MFNMIVCRFRRLPCTYRFPPIRAFHTRSFAFITRLQIEEAPDVRNLLDDCAKPELPSEEREKRLKNVINEVKTLAGEQRPTEKEIHFLKMAHVYRGKALSELNRREEALEEISKGEELSPDSVLFLEKARILTMINQFSTAIRYLSKTIDEVLPGDALYVESLITRAQCYSQVGDKTKALQDINEAIFYQPDNLRGRLERGRFLLDDNPDAAIEEYENVLDAENIDNDTTAETYFRIGYAYLKKGEPDVAIRSLQQSERLDPNHPRVSLLKEILDDLDEKMPKMMDEGKEKIDVADLPQEETDAEVDEALVKGIDEEDESESTGAKPASSRKKSPEKEEKIKEKQSTEGSRKKPTEGTQKKSPVISEEKLKHAQKQATESAHKEEKKPTKEVKEKKQATESSRKKLPEKDEEKLEIPEKKQQSSRKKSPAQSSDEKKQTTEGSRKKAESAEKKKSSEIPTEEKKQTRKKSSEISEKDGGQLKIQPTKPKTKVAHEKN